MGNNVKMVNLAKLESENIILNTHNVNIDTENKMISTAADIKAVQGQSVLTGVGASFNYESQFLTIKSKVKIIYVTNQ